MNEASSYRPGREIARGGMGAVLDARDNKLGRSVALKVMLRRNASEEEQQRFLQEARVLGQLAHPNIVPVHDVGTDEQGRLFYTMKLVQGVTLHEVIGKLKAGDKETLARYPLNSLLTVFQKVCDAVAFAHSRGIIHRDLKPQNIMVGEFGEVLVMDWGLAKILPGSAAAEEAARTPPLRGQLGQTGPTGTLPLGGRAALLRGTNDPQVVPANAGDQATLVSGTGTLAAEATMASGTGGAAGAPRLVFGESAATPVVTDSAGGGTYATLEGAVMGTPHYMSPEQAEGRISDLDARSDIFSLGGILYALLTLRPPVEGESLEDILLKVRRGDITPPSALNAGSSTEHPHHNSNGEVVEPKKIVPLPHLPGGCVPAALSAVVMKALSVQREERYPDVAAFAADLTAYQGGFATSAENANALTLLRLFIQRHKVLTAAASLIVLLTAGFMAKVIASEGKATRNANTARDNEKRAVENETRAVQTLAELRRAAPTFFSQAKSLLDEGKFEDAMEKIGYALNLVPEDADYRLFRAHLLEALQRLDQAAKEYRAVLAARPNDVSAWQNLALCERLLAQNRGAATLQREGQMELVDALLKQNRKVEALPLVILLGRGQADAEAGIRARLAPFKKQQGWSDSRLSRLPNGSFRLSLEKIVAVNELSMLKDLPITSVSLRNTSRPDLRSLAGLPLRDLDLLDVKDADFTALRGLRLERLNLTRTEITDLSPLAGMKLRSLHIAGISPLKDIRPLAGMPLEEFSCPPDVTDLSPLQGAPLHAFTCPKGVTDLRPLAGAPLTRLDVSGCKLIKDFSPLLKCTLLETLLISDLASDAETLRRMPQLKWLSDQRNPGMTAAEFWQQRGAALTGREQWRKKLESVWQLVRAKGWAKYPEQAVTGDVDTQQVTLTFQSSTLNDLGPFRGLPVIHAALRYSPIGDLEPLRGMPLEFLDITGTRVTDLEPLRDCKFLRVLITNTKVKELTPILGLPLVELHLKATAVSDVSPLARCLTLEMIQIPKSATGIEALRTLPKLRRISFDARGNLNKAQTAAEFWAQFDKSEK